MVGHRRGGVHYDLDPTGRMSQRGKAVAVIVSEKLFIITTLGSRLTKGLKAPGHSLKMRGLMRVTKSDIATAIMPLFYQESNTLIGVE